MGEFFIVEYNWGYWVFGVVEVVVEVFEVFLEEVGVVLEFFNEFVIFLEYFNGCYSCCNIRWVWGV